MQAFEIILQKNQVTAEEWQKLVQTLANHIKGLRPFTVVVCFKESLIRYFLLSNHDLSQLSSGIEGVIISPLDKNDESLLQVPDATATLRFLKIPTGGNLLDLKERYQTRDSLELRLVRIEVQRLGKRISAKMYSYFYGGHTVKASRQQLAQFPAHLMQIDFATNTNYLKKSAPKYLNLEKSLHILSSENNNAIFTVDAFPYFSHDYYLNIGSYEFNKHSLILGATGTGKSKLIDLMIDRLAHTDLASQYRIVVIDPHASLGNDLDYLPSSRVINFSGEATELFPDASADISAATELTTTLFKSLIADQYNPRLERVLRYSLFVLLTAQTMSLDMLKTFLVDIDIRNQILNHVKDYVPINVVKFFGADYNEVRTNYYTEAVMPIISLVDEMQMQPALIGNADLSLAKTIQSNYLTVFSLNKVSMGEKVVKTVAGLLIQQIFLLAQARVFNQKVILFVDEVSLVQNPALASILAEARKFNLSIILSQQYFGQIEKDLRDAILSNVYNYYIFKVSEEDARSLEGNLEIAVPTEILAEAKDRGIKESEVRAKMMVELDPRQCLIRPYAGGQLLPCIIGRTVDVPNRSDVLNGQPVDLKPYKQAKLPTKFVAGETAVPALKELETSTPKRSLDDIIKDIGIVATADNIKSQDDIKW
jgi:hypothetical protein